MRFSHYTSFDSAPTVKDFSGVEELANWLNTQKPVAEKDTSPFIVPAVYTGNSRAQDAIEKLTAVVLDYDDGSASPEEVADAFDHAKLEYVICNSFSDRPEHRRFFAILPFSEPIDAEQQEDVLKQIVKPALNGHGHFAKESEVAGQARFIAPSPGQVRDIIISQQGARPIDTSGLPAVDRRQGDRRRTNDPFMHLDASPSRRQLFRLALRYIDPSCDRMDWIAIIGCGCRMYGISKSTLRAGTLTTDQWALIGELEDWSSRSPKYTNPESGPNIRTTRHQRKNADGDMVPSLVMDGAVRGVESHGKMITLAGVLKRIDNNAGAFLDMLDLDFPELLKEAKGILSEANTPEATPVSFEEVQAAASETELFVANERKKAADYDTQVRELLNKLPEGKAKQYIKLFANRGQDGEQTVTHPALSLLMAMQTAAVVMANRVWVDTGQYGTLGPNLYCIALAESGSGKTVALNFMRDVLNESGYGQALQQSKAFSERGMYNIFADRGPVVLQTSDEAKDWFAFADARNTAAPTNANQNTLEAFLLTLFNQSVQGGKVDSSVTAAVAKGDKNRLAPSIHEPNLNLTLIGTHEVRRMWSSGMVESGMLPRFIPLVLPESRDDPEERVAKDKQKRLDYLSRMLPQTVVDFLDISAAPKDAGPKRVGAILRKLDISLALAGRGRAMKVARQSIAAEFLDEAPIDEKHAFKLFQEGRREEDRSNSTLRLSPSVNQILFNASNELGEMAALDSRLAPIANRQIEKIMRMALILTILNDPEAETIDPEMALFAGYALNLLQRPWLETLRETQILISRGNRLNPELANIRRELEPDRELFRAVEGLSDAQMLEIPAFARLINGIQSRSQRVQNDAVELLDEFGIMRLRVGRLFRWFHPEHKIAKESKAALQYVEGET